jgi:hypothetical protein
LVPQDSRLLFRNTKEIPADWEERDVGLRGAMLSKWRRLYHWQHPEPGIAFTYQQWKLGQTGKAIINRTNRTRPDAIPKHPEPDHEFYSVALQDTFRKQGLQVIVKLASIELTPDKLSYAGGSWHIEGMLNEHIVATAIYYYDVSNVTSARLSFRQETKMDHDEFVYESYNFEPLAAIFAVPGIENMLDGPYMGGPPSNQELGSIATPEGRLLAWPNTLQHRVEPFELVNHTAPDHRRFIVLWLVDPHYRLCSTRNVPPQRHDWRAKEALTQARLAERGLSRELLDIIDKETGEWPMGLEEARALRLELTEERTKAEYINGSG